MVKNKFLYSKNLNLQTGIKQNGLKENSRLSIDTTTPRTETSLTVPSLPQNCKTETLLL